MHRTLYVAGILFAIACGIALFLWLQPSEPDAQRLDKNIEKQEASENPLEDEKKDKVEKKSGGTGDKLEKEPEKPETQRGWMITGRVVNSKGKPVSGARFYRDFEGQTYGGDPGFECLGVETNAQGIFKFSALVLESFWYAPELRPVTIIHKDYCSRKIEVEGLHPEGNILDLGDIQMETGACISGYVRTHTGAPVSGARVVLGGEFENYPGMKVGHFDRSQGRSISTDEFRKIGGTNEEGWYCLKGVEPGKYILRAWLVGFAPAVSEAFAVEGNNSKEIDLYLEKGGQVEGSVTFNDGVTVPGCTVTVCWEPYIVVESDKPGEKTCIGYISHHTAMPRHENGYYKYGSEEEKRKVFEVVHDFFRQALTDQKGHFRIEGVPEGRKFQVTAVLPGEEGGFSEKKGAETGEEVDFVFTRSERIKLTAVDAETGERLKVRLAIDALGIPEGGYYPKRTSRKLPEDKPAYECILEPGKFEIIAWAPGFHEGTRIITVPQREKTGTIELKLRKSTGKIKGRVIDIETREPLTGIKVHAYEWIMGTGTKGSMITGEDGSFELHGFLGTYRNKQIGHWVKAGSKRYLEKKVEGTFNGKDAVEYLIELQRGAIITGRVIRLDGRSPVGTGVICKPPRGCFSDWLKASVTEEDGAFEFGPLEGGPHVIQACNVFERVTVEPGGNAAVTLTIPGR